MIENLKNIIKGDTVVEPLEFLDGDNNKVPFNITDWTVYFTIKKHYSMSDAEANLQKIITEHIDALNGISAIELSSADTNALNIGRYYYDVRIKYPDGAVKTIVNSATNVLPSVTGVMV